MQQHLDRETRRQCMLLAVPRHFITDVATHRAGTSAKNTEMHPYGRPDILLRLLQLPIARGLSHK